MNFAINKNSIQFDRYYLSKFYLCFHCALMAKIAVHIFKWTNRCQNMCLPTDVHVWNNRWQNIWGPTTAKTAFNTSVCMTGQNSCLHCYLLWCHPWSLNYLCTAARHSPFLPLFPLLKALLFSNTQLCVYWRPTLLFRHRPMYIIMSWQHMSTRKLWHHTLLIPIYLARMFEIWYMHSLDEWMDECVMLVVIYIRDFQYLSITP